MPTTHRTTRAFTLIELLVVISIMGILALIGFPVINAMTSTSQGFSGEASVSTVLSAARIMGQRSTKESMSAAGIPFSDNAQYAGTAVIFYPDTDRDSIIRMQILESDQTASTNSVGNDPTSNNFLQNQSPKRHGFAAMSNTDSVALPARIGVAGITGNDRYVVDSDRIAVRFAPNGKIEPQEEFENIYVQDDFSGGSDYNTSNHEVPVVSIIALYDRRAAGAEPTRAWLLDPDRSNDEVRLLYLNPNTGQVLNP